MLELSIDVYGDNMISKNSSCHEKWCQTITDKEVYISFPVKRDLFSMEIS